MSTNTLTIDRPTLIPSPALAGARWRRLTLGAGVLLHGLAHSNAIVWVTGTGPFWLVWLLWIIAVIGYVASGLGILGAPLVRPVWPWLMGAATLASLVLLALAASPLASLGILLDLMLVPGAVRWGPDALAQHRRRAVTSVLASIALLWITATVLWRPIYVQWGTTPAERAREMFGDNGLTMARYRIDHAVTIKAPVDSVWPWLAQIGQDRAGFYSYDWLERLFGANVHNANAINPAWQRIEAGDFVRAAPSGYFGGRLGEVGWRVTDVLPGRAVVLENWGAFVLQPIDSATTRFHVRSRGEGAPSLLGVMLGPINVFVFEPAHFIMQRKMLLGIRERAERTTQY